MLDIQIQGSSSAGNNYVLSDQGSSIMIEAGVKLKNILRQGVDLKPIKGLLVTHEHGDHSKYIQDILSSSGFDLFASQGTIDQIGIKRRYHVLKAGNQQKIDDWLILPFNTIHDHPKAPVKEPLGFFILSPSGYKIVFMTDTNYCPVSFPSGVTHWLIECNHDINLVRECNRPKSVQDRIISTHMDINTCKDFFSHQDLSTTEDIYLIHLSGENGDGPRFKKEIEELTHKRVTIA